MKIEIQYWRIPNNFQIQPHIMYIQCESWFFMLFNLIWIQFLVFVFLLHKNLILVLKMRKTKGFTIQFVGITATIVQTSYFVGCLIRNQEDRKIILDGNQLSKFELVKKTSWRTIFFSRLFGLIGVKWSLYNNAFTME